MGAPSVVRPLRVVAVLGLVAASLLLAGGARASAHCSPGWGAQPRDVGQGPNLLTGVAATSPCSAWAVGYYNNGTAEQTLIEHWDGKAWKVQPSPNPGGSSQPNELNHVAATSPTNAWAVGYYYDGTANHTLIEHWNGKAWKVAQGANPGGRSNQNELRGVAAVSAADAWAVGLYFDGTSFRTLIEHWDGKVWKVQTSSNRGRSSHNGRFIMQRDLVSLVGVTAISPKNAWAVGYKYDGTAEQTLIEHWNGKVWKAQPSPNRGGTTAANQLHGVAATSSTNAWAVGSSFGNSRTSVQKTLVEHWNGKAWKMQPSPDPVASSPSDLVDVAATSPGNAWAVGQYGASQAQDPGLIEHWNGTTWNVQPSLNIGQSSLLGVAATSSHDAWAVGEYNNGSVDQALAVHCC
jgi:hypothetical protein